MNLISIMKDCFCQLSFTPFTYWTLLSSLYKLHVSQNHVVIYLNLFLEIVHFNAYTFVPDSLFTHFYAYTFSPQSRTLSTFCCWLKQPDVLFHLSKNIDGIITKELCNKVMSLNSEIFANNIFFLNSSKNPKLPDYFENFVRQKFSKGE